MAVEVQLYDDLEAVAAAAAGTLDRAAQPLLFDRLDWLRLTQAHCPPSGRLLAAHAHDGAAGAWLFLAEAHGRATAFASWYTLRFDIPGRTPALVAAIAHALRPRLHHVSLAPLGGGASMIADAFAAAGWRVALAPATANWSIAIPVHDWAAYLAHRPGRLRETLRRRARANDLAIAIHTRFDAPAWADYEAVYRASWKPAEGSFAFLRALAEREGAAGTLRLGIAHRDGAPVAAQLWLTEHGTATIHKLAHVEAAKAGSPGTLLSAAMFRHAIEADRVTCIDFGTGDEPYKADWMDHRETLHRFDAWNPHAPRGLAGLVRARVAALVRRIARV